LVKQRLHLRPVNVRKGVLSRAKRLQGFASSATDESLTKAQLSGMNLREPLTSVFSLKRAFGVVTPQGSYTGGYIRMTQVLAGCHAEVDNTTAAEVALPAPLVVPKVGGYPRIAMLMQCKFANLGIMPMLR
jgi:hypothetical protein